jgi:excisionase family DNA binding protein
MTTAEVADRLGVSVRTVVRWSEEGRLPEVRKSPYLFTRDSVDKLAAELIEELSARMGKLAAS